MGYLIYVILRHWITLIKGSGISHLTCSARSCDFVEQVGASLTPAFAQDEIILSPALPARVANARMRATLGRGLAVLSSWRAKHVLSMASAMLDSYTFMVEARGTSDAFQHFWFSIILCSSAAAMLFNAFVLAMDFLRMSMPEAGDRTLRISSLMKCVSLLLKLFVLQVPRPVTEIIEAEANSAIFNSTVIPFWICMSSCPPGCHNMMDGQCVWSAPPHYDVCHCKHTVAGINNPIKRFKVIMLCFISISLLLALTLTSYIKLRRIFTKSCLGSTSAALVIVLPPLLFTTDTVYFMHADLAFSQKDSGLIFLVLAVPAALFHYAA